ncbi:Uncharacterised protein [Chlamydia abortus]|nr:Uncharacterised protein [Chlamydia abortus]
MIKVPVLESAIKFPYFTEPSFTEPTEAVSILIVEAASRRIASEDGGVVPSLPENTSWTCDNKTANSCGSECLTLYQKTVLSVGFSMPSSRSLIKSIA